MKRDDILIFEKQLHILEQEAKLLEGYYNKKDEKKFNDSKNKIINAQNIIKKIT